MNRLAILAIAPVLALAQFPEGGGGSGSGGSGAPNASFTWTGSATTGDITHTFSTDAAAKAVITCYNPSGVLLTGWTRSDPDTATIRITFGGAQSTGTKCSANATGTGATGAQGPEGPAGAGNPGGTDTQIQYNNGGAAFGGLARRGNGASVQMGTGAFATDDCMKYDASGNAVSAGAACGSGGGGAPADASYIVATANGPLSAEIIVGVVDDTIIVANGTTWQAKAIVDCDDTGGNHLNYDTATNTFSCGTSGGAGGGIASLEGQTGATQTFTDDTNVTIVSGGNTHAITWAGTLAVSRMAATLDFTDKTAVIVPNSTTVPGTCTPGSLYMDTDATDGTRFKGCTAANLWEYFLTTTGSGVGYLTITEGAAPGAGAASGEHRLYFRSDTSKLCSHENGGSEVCYGATSSFGVNGSENGEITVHSASAGNGSTFSALDWWSDAGSYVRPTGTNKRMAFDVMVNGTGSEAHLDICGNDIRADSQNWECLELIKFRDNSAAVSAKKGGSGTVRDLGLQTYGGRLLLGNTGDSSTNGFTQMIWNAGTQQFALWTNNQNSSGFFMGSGGTQFYNYANAGFGWYTNNNSTAKMSLSAAGALSVPGAISSNAPITAPGFLSSGGSAAGLMELTQGTACTPAANSVCYYAPSSIGTAYGVVSPSAVGSTGVVHVSVSGAVATYSHAAIQSASDTVSGIAELATAAETTTGTDAARAITPDGLAGSDFGIDTFVVECVPDATALATGDGKCYIGPLDAKYNGWNIIRVVAGVGAAISSSGAITVDVDRCGVVATGIRCSGTNVSVLSTLITIDANEDSTSTAATPSVINGSNDDLATDQWLRVNIDGAGTGTQGLYLWIVVQKP